MTFVCAPILNQIKTQIFKASEMNIFIVLLNWVSLKYICLRLVNKMYLVAVYILIPFEYTRWQYRCGYEK